MGYLNLLRKLEQIKHDSGVADPDVVLMINGKVVTNWDISYDPKKDEIIIYQ